MSKINDNDLREALRRREAQRQPVEVPDGFFDSVMSEIESEASPTLWQRWLAVAACIAVLVGVGSVLWLTNNAEPAKVSAVVAANSEVAMPAVEQKAEQETVDVRDVELAQLDAEAVKPTNSKVSAKSAVPTRRVESVAAFAATEVVADEVTTSGETDQQGADEVASPKAYPSPARMDEFISKLADNQGAAKTILDCTADREEGAVDMAYTFREKSDFDLINRLLVSACSYPDTAQGYFLNYSPQQFFFSIDDESDGRSYFWIAERVGDEKCILYSLHSQSGAQDITECYLQYRSKLICNNINTYSNL